MASKTRDSEYSQDFRAQAQRELLHVLLQDESVYYWNPAHPESEIYFAELEQAFASDDWLEDELEDRSQNLFSRLDELWAQKVPSENLLAALADKFAQRVPLSWLDAIARNAQQISYGLNNSTGGLSLKEQLVQCVQNLLPIWPEDDLVLFARPLLVMRSGNADATDSISAGIDSVLAKVRPMPFSELSEMEQARLSLAIARYALDELDRSN